MIPFSAARRRTCSIKADPRRIRKADIPRRRPPSGAEAGIRQVLGPSRSAPRKPRSTSRPRRPPSGTAQARRLPTTQLRGCPRPSEQVSLPGGHPQIDDRA